jgi:hypothetical protein
MEVVLIMRIKQSFLSLFLVLMLLVLSINPALAEGPLTELPKGGDPGDVETPLFDKIKMMEPIQNYLSGSVQMIVKGIDNRASMEGESFRTPDGADFSKIESPLNVGLNSPVMQAVGPGVLVPYRDPSPSFSRGLLVTRDFSARTLQTEPSLAVNPEDPDHLVLSTIDYNFPSNSVYVSIDGGQTWEGPKQTKYLRDDLGSGGDPVLAFGKKSKVYLASISIGTKDYSIGSAAGEAEISSMAVASSDDGGYTWNEPVSAARSAVTADVQQDPSGRLRGTISLGFLDKPWLTIGPHPTIEDQEMLYLSYTEFVTRYDILYIGELPVLGVPVSLSTPMVVYSSDGGVTWSEPVGVGPTVKREVGDTNSQEGPDVPGVNKKDQPAANAEKDQANQAAVNDTYDQKNEADAPAGDDPQYRAEVLAAAAQQGTGAKEEGHKRTIQGPMPVVDSKGNVYVTWLDSTDDDAMKGIGEFYMAKSGDGGTTWEKPTRIASFLEPPFRPRNAFFRYWSSAFPKSAAGSKDELYVVYTALPPDKPSDEGDVFFIRSIDGGKRWSRPKRLNTDDTNSPQFFPAITVGPDGTIHVMWGDMRDDVVGTRYHIYYTSSTDGGETWGFKNEQLDLQVGDARVTDFPTNPNKAFPSGAFIGDYFSIAATKDEAYMVWADGRLGEYGAINQKIGFARKRPVPNPEIFLSPDAGPGGETVTVQGHGFQPDMNYYLQVGGNTISAGRSNADGVITASAFVPISGEGAHPVSLVDESGNAASTSFYMEFGFDNVQKQLKSLDDEVKILSGSAALTPTNGVTGTNGNVKPVVPQMISYEASKMDSLETQVKELKGLVQNLVTKRAATPVQTVAASSILAGNESLPWGLTALGGLLLGAIFMYVRMSVGRKNDKEG